MLSTPSHHPILANLIVDPANVQSLKKTDSKATKATSLSDKNVKALSSLSVSTSSKVVKCLMPSNRHDSTLSRRMRKKVCEEQNSAFLEHPHSIKLCTRKRKLSELMVKIFNLADMDMIAHV